MTLARPQTHVPGIDLSHPLVNGLRGAWLGEPESFVVRDRIGTADLERVLTPTWTGSSVGYALDCTGDGHGFEADPMPSYLKLPLPITIGMFFHLVGTPENNANLWGIRYDTGGGSPFLSFALGYSSAGDTWRWLGNSAGSFFTTSFGTGDLSVANFIGLDVLVLMKVTTGGLEAWMKDEKVTNGTAKSNPTYAIATMGISSPSRVMNILFYCGFIWDRELYEADYQILRRDPFEMFRPKRRIAVLAPQAVAITVPEIVAASTSFENRTFKPDPIFVPF